MDTTNKNVPINNEVLGSEAYSRVKDDLDALAPDELQQINLDVPTAVTTILGLLPEVAALRERMVKELPSFDIAAFDKLESYALALSFAQTGYLTATQPPDDLATLAADAIKLRDQLSADANALAHRALVDAGQLAQLRGGNGYKNLAQDLQILSKVMEESWPQIQSKTGTVADDLQMANRMATRLMRIVGLREQGPALLAAASDLRMRAFTRFIEVYEDTRRAVTYLRSKQGDAESIVPSLYTGRGKRRPDPEPPVPATGQPPVASSGAPSPTPVGSGTTELPAVTPAQIAAATAKGAPASKDPFLS